MSLILDISLKKTIFVGTEKHYFIDYKTSNKFKDDKIYSDSNDFFLLLDGVVLNKRELLQSSSENNWKDYLVESYKKEGDTFFKKLKGSYYGVLYDKKTDKWIIFNDHIGSKYLYHANYEGHVVFSDNYSDLGKYLVKKSIPLSLNIQGAELLLSYGYTFEDITISNEIKRMLIGHYSLITNNKLKFNKFFQLSNNPIEITEDEAIEIIDKKFRNAIKLAFDKDLEYGYKHLASISGGLDSRMVCWVANKLGYNNQLNITFSQTNSLDETIAKEIASDLKNEWLFKALDNGSFLKDIDATTILSGGNVISYGLSHQMSMLNYMNFDKLGILHTGQLGDVVISSFSKSKAHIPYSKTDGMYSSVLTNELNDLKFKGVYPNQEIFLMYVRGFYGANQGLAPAQNFTEVYSPFYDIDFLNFALSIPLKLRVNHNLYKKWILKKYPAAANYKWDKINTKIDNNFKFNLGKREIYINNLPEMIINKLCRRSSYDNINSMNPIGYWYNNNDDLKDFINKYYKKNISLIKNKRIINFCIKLFNDNSILEKIQVISLLSSVKLLQKINNGIKK